MGTRSASETVARILVAFMREKTWKQKELADHCDVTTKTLRRHLDELSVSMPLELQHEGGRAYWSVPHRWFPTGTLLQAADAALVARLLARLPRAPEREEALRTILLQGDPPNAPGNEAAERSVEGVLAALEDAARDRKAATLRYHSASRGARTPRTVSIHRIVYGANPRFVAVCHRADTLKWFRVDRTDAVTLTDTPFRARAPEEIEAFVATSLGGFRRGTPLPCTFFVRDPEARWVVDNLPHPMSAEHLPEGARIHVHTAALEVLARFVVGLGDAARAETPELRTRVLALARGAIDANLPVCSARKVNTRSPRKRHPSWSRPRR